MFYLIRPYEDRYNCEQDWDNWAKESKFMIAEDSGVYTPLSLMVGTVITIVCLIVISISLLKIGGMI